MLLDRKTLHGFTGLGDAIDDACGPARFNADHDNSRYVWIGTGTDERSKMQFKILSKLKAPVMMGKRQGAFDVVGDGFTGGVGEIVQRQDDDMVANTDPTVLAAVAPKI